MSDNIYSTTKESSNYARLCRLLLDVGTDVFRYVFDNFAPPADLFIFLSKHEAKLKKKPNLREYQKKKLYPDNGKPLSNDFDISLLYTLLRETCNMEPPMNGWGNKVDPSDNSISANIEKIRQIRNDIYGHVLRACLQEYIFEENWLVLSKALISLGGQRYEQIIYRLRYVSLDPDSDEDYMRRFSDWVSEGSKRLDAVEESVANILNIVTSMATPDEQDQLKLIIEFRAKEDRCFVETRAFLDIENQLIRNGSVLIVGDPGEGKTFSAWHIILKSLIEGFQFHLVDSPHEWQSKWTPTSKQILFVDDCFGKSQLVPEKVEAWLKLQDLLRGCIDKTHTYIIATTRRSIYRDSLDLITKLVLFGPSVDINDLCRCLTPSERVKILKSHLNNEIDINIESSISTTSTPRFPISCRLFASDQQFRNQGAAFFENPINQLKDEIIILSKTNNIAFAGLVLLMLFDGCLNCHLMHSDYYEKSKAISSFFPWMKYLCCNKTKNTRIHEATESIKQIRKLPKVTRIEDFRNGIEHMLGIYVVYDNGQYRFVHESISETIGVVLAGEDIEFVLKNATPCFIQQRVTVYPTCKADGVQNDETMVVVREPYFQTLAKRLTDDVLSGHLDTTFQSQSVHNIGFTTFWCTYLSSVTRSKYLKFTRCIDDKGLSVQYWAARTGNKILLKFFLDDQDPTNDVIHGACYSESIDCVHMVLNHKVNTNATDNSGFTPLLISCVKKNRDITRLLLSRGADVNKEHADFGTVLHYACWNMDLDLVTILLQKGAKSNVVTTAGWPNVVFDGNGNDIIRMLIKREKTLRLTSNTNWSPLHLACGKNNIEIVTLLIQYGANINQYTTQGWTPLFCATKKGLHHIVTILIKKGAFVNMKDHFGVACIHRVCYDGYLHVARALLSAKADVNIQSKALYTPLHCACENGHEDLVHLLLKYGADTRLCSMSNKTPRDVAVKKQRFDIISVIEQHEQRC
ncbi:uncharacterized protein [Mytilus edulis]|uniref:uncharacterized protein n=1 Tax=Mytilus edulis TaxID=6550 RepID=UPI0039F11DE0